MFKSKSFLVAISLFCCIQAFCGEQKLFEQLSVKDGLPHSEVMAITCDSNGYLWLGTLNGLARFDGYHISTYIKDIYGGALSNVRILSLYIDNNNLYIGTEGGGLNIMDLSTNKITQPENSPDIINKIVKGINHNIWIGSSLGIFSISGNTCKLACSHIANVLDVQEISNDILLAASKNGLYLIDIKNNSSQRLFDGFFRSILKLNNNTFLVGGSQGLFLLDSKKTLNIISPLDVSCSLRTSDGIWVGTINDGIYRYDDKLNLIGQFHQQNNEGLANNGIRAIYKDFSGVLWFGTQNGLCKYLDRASEFAFYSSILDSNNPKTASFYQDPITSDLWISSQYSGIRVMKSNGETYIPNLPSLSKSTVSAFFRDRNGSLWIGTWDNLYILKTGYEKAIARHQTPSMIRFANKFQIEGITIFKIVEDKDGEIWLSTNNGIYRYTPSENDFYEGKISHYANDSDHGGLITGNTITDIFVDQKAPGERKIIWAGTNHGLNKIVIDGMNKRLHIIKIYSNPNSKNGMQGDFVSVIHQDKDSNLWIVCINGFLNEIIGHRFSNDKPIFKTVDINANGSFDTTESLQEDNKGYFWMGGLRLIRFNPHDLSIKYYEGENGIQNNSFKIWSSCKLSSGNLVFGGINGFSVFNPNKLKDNNVVPKIAFNDLSIFDNVIEPNQEYRGKKILSKVLNDTKNLTLPYFLNSIKISFSALHYASPSQNSYKYKLSGYDSDWHYSTGNNNIATYTNLSPGTYTFTVYASNCDNVWCNLPKTLSIKIRPPLWETNVAYIFYLFALAAAFFALRRSLILKEKRKNDVIVQNLKIKEEENRMNQMKTVFTDISHELKTPLTLISAPIEELASEIKLDSVSAKKFEYVRKNISHLLDLIEQIMDFLRFENNTINLHLSEENIVPLITSVMQFFEDMASRRSIHFVFDCKEKDITIICDRDRIEKVLFNILGNAFKYTPDHGEIKVSCIDRENDILVKISDNGPGISPEDIGHVFERFYTGKDNQKGGTGIGLALCKAIIEQHKGTISLESIENSGSTFFFTLLKGVSHFSQKDIQNMSKGYKNSPYSIKYGDSTTLSTESVVNEASPNFKTNIMIVEDNSELRSYLQESLRSYYKVSVAEDGKKAYELALEKGFDLIISDIMMPVMDGMELCKAIKTDIRLSHIPVILLTSKGEVESKIEGYNIGADDYIPKPFEMKLLIARIDNLIREREKLRSLFQKQVVIEPSKVTVLSINEQFLSKCLKLVEDRISDSSYCVEEFCKDLDLSRPAVYKKIKSLTGLSVVEFIRSIRLKRAAQLLMQESSSIKDIMYMVGFDNGSYFSECFKKEFGCTPSEYVKRESGSNRKI